jgi:hypothetical protein
MKKRRTARPKNRAARTRSSKPAQLSGNRPTSRPRARQTKTPAELTEIEANLLSEMQNRFHLENNPLEGGLVLRRATDNETLRPASVNLNTVKALEQRGLIRAVKSRDPLTTVWRVSKKG